MTRTGKVIALGLLTEGILFAIFFLYSVATLGGTGEEHLLGKAILASQVPTAFLVQSGLIDEAVELPVLFAGQTTLWCIIYFACFRLATSKDLMRKERK